MAFLGALKGYGTAIGRGAGVLNTQGHLIRPQQEESQVANQEQGVPTMTEPISPEQQKAAQMAQIKQYLGELMRQQQQQKQQQQPPRNAYQDELADYEAQQQRRYPYQQQAY